MPKWPSLKSLSRAAARERQAARSAENRAALARQKAQKRGSKMEVQQAARAQQEVDEAIDRQMAAAGTPQDALSTAQNEAISARGELLAAAGRTSQTPNTPLNIELLRARIAAAYGAPSAEKQWLSATVGETASSALDVSGVPRVLAQWIQSDMMRFWNWLDSAMAVNPPRFIDALPAAEADLIRMTATGGHYGTKRRYRAISALIKREGRNAPVIIGENKLWPDTAQRLPEELHQRLSAIANFSPAHEYAPPRKALEVLLKASGISDEALIRNVSEVWWKDLLDAFVLGPGSQTPMASGFRGYGMKPMAVFDFAKLDQPYHQWTTVPVPNVLQDYIRRRGQGAADYGIRRYATEVANAGVQPAAHVHNYLERNGRVIEAASWSKFITGNGGNYDWAAAELDTMLAELNQEPFRRFTLTRINTVGTRVVNADAQVAHMWRMIPTLSEKLGGTTSISAPDARTAETAAKATAFLRSLFTVRSKPENMEFHQQVLPHLPPDVALKAEQAPRLLMQEIEPFFANSALANDQVSRLWTARMVEGARGSASKMRPDSEIGQIVLRGMRRYYDELGHGGKPGRSQMIEVIRKQLRDEAMGNPLLRREIRNYALFTNVPDARLEAWDFLSKWMAVPQRRDAALPSRAQFDIFFKIVTGAAPALAAAWMSRPASAEELNDADMAYLLRKGELDEEEQSSIPAPGKPGGLLAALGIGAGLAGVLGMSKNQAAIGGPIHSTKDEHYSFKVGDQRVVWHRAIEKTPYLDEPDPVWPTKEQVRDFKDLRTGRGVYYHAVRHSPINKTRFPIDVPEEQLYSGALHFGTKKAALERVDAEFPGFLDSKQPYNKLGEKLSPEVEQKIVKEIDEARRAGKLPKMYRMELLPGHTDARLWDDRSANWLANWRELRYTETPMHSTQRIPGGVLVRKRGQRVLGYINDAEDRKSISGAIMRMPKSVIRKVEEVPPAKVAQWMKNFRRGLPLTGLLLLASYGLSKLTHRKSADKKKADAA